MSGGSFPEGSVASNSFCFISFTSYAENTPTIILSVQTKFPAFLNRTFEPVPAPPYPFDPPQTIPLGNSLANTIDKRGILVGADGKSGAK
jgi:hypothetical protein